jgi:hypothetical protein
MVSGPLMVVWQAGDQFFTVLSQDDTGPCTPSAAAAASLFQMIGTLPRSSEADWTQLVADHPITLSVADQRPFRTPR